MNQQIIPINQIRIDGGTQPRVAIDEQIVAEYVEMYSAGANLPPVTVFFDGASYWLADGFHRYWARKRLDAQELASDVRQGTQRDAILFSVGANAAHGLRRTNADKRKAVLTLLQDPEWSAWPQTEIAEACNVSRQYVCQLAGSLGASCQRLHDAQRRVTRGGSTYDQNTSPISQANRRSEPAKPAPRAGAARISSKAMAPVLGHSKPLPRTALDLPHDPVIAAKAMVELFETDFLVQLVDELSNLLAGFDGNQA